MRYWAGTKYWKQWLEKNTTNDIDVDCENAQAAFVGAETLDLTKQRIPWVICNCTDVTHLHLHRESHLIYLHDSAELTDVRATAEHTVMLMLLCLHGFKRTRFDPPGLELRDAEVVIVGTGRIAKQVWALCSQWGAKSRLNDWTAPAGRADVISIHLPANVGWQCDDHYLMTLGSPAYLINTSRGNLIDEQAVYDAIQSNWLKGYASDFPAVHPDLASDPRCYFTHHIAGYCEPSLSQTCRIAYDRWLKLIG